MMADRQETSNTGISITRPVISDTNTRIDHKMPSTIDVSDMTVNMNNTKTATGTIANTEKT